jgi:sugar phosphate isomerase/epimerase
MLRAISTHVFLKQRLHPGLLDSLNRAGAQAIEIFAAQQHFDYTSRTHVKEIADWFASNPVAFQSMHAPLYSDADMGRAGGPAVNVVHPDKSRRIDSMDEWKRALEVAETLPFKFLVLHLGERGDEWSPRVLDHAVTALEHMRVFGKPLGVNLLLENIQNDVTRPEHLLEVVRVGHFKDIGVCFDIGHANLNEGVAASLAQLKPIIGSTHLHDNHGEKDEHLWPGEGNIEWEPAMDELKTATRAPAAVLEIHHSLGETAEHVITRAVETWTKFGL